MWRKRVTDWLVYALVRTLICLLQAVPLSWGYAFARLVARFAYLVDRRHREVAFENLRRAFPGHYSERQLRELVLAVYEHFASVIIEIAQIPRLFRPRNWHRYVRILDPGPAVDRLLDGRPTILATAHLGNWEMIGYVLGAFGFRPQSVARPLDNPYLERLLKRFRTHTGQGIIYKRGAVDQVSEALRAGKVVAFLLDQDAGRRGVFVDFFGRPASTHKAMALLALKFDAPILVGFACRSGTGLRYDAWVEQLIEPARYRHEPDPVHAITQAYAAAVERAVRRRPEQYLWLHRRWKHSPPRARCDARKQRRAA